jgi:hypothetical protein
LDNLILFTLLNNTFDWFWDISTLCKVLTEMYTVCIIFHSCAVSTQYERKLYSSQVFEGIHTSRRYVWSMPGKNCSFFGCASSSRHTERSFFKIPSVNTTDGDETAALKSTARAEWLWLLLRTREITEDLKTRIDANNIYLCDLHFKPECIISRKYVYGF